MKRLSRITVVLCLLVAGFSIAEPLSARESAEPPSTVTLEYLSELYEPVLFEHEMHTEMYSCNSCHHHTAGDGTENDSCKRCHETSQATDDMSCSGCHIVWSSVAAGTMADEGHDLYHIDKPGLKGALHLKCLGCHRDESGPVGCNDCHTFTPAGRKRFTGMN